MNDVTIEYSTGRLVLYLDKMLPVSRPTLKKIFNQMRNSNNPRIIFNLFISNAGYEIKIKRGYSAYKAKKIQENIEYMNELYKNIYGKNIESYDNVYLKYYGGDKK